MNRLYYGDNLEWLANPKAFPDACVDLVYLDPPFNSNATYSQLFKSPDGKTADSQIDAFEDTWSWGVSAEAAYDRVMKVPIPTSRSCCRRCAASSTTMR